MNSLSNFTVQLEFFLQLKLDASVRYFFVLGISQSSIVHQVQPTLCLLERVNFACLVRYLLLSSFNCSCATRHHGKTFLGLCFSVLLDLFLLQGSQHVVPRFCFLLLPVRVSPSTNCFSANASFSSAASRASKADSEPPLVSPSWLVLQHAYVLASDGLP